MEVGGLNDYLVQLAAAQTKVPLSSTQSFTMNNIIVKGTDFTCSAAAQKAGGCPKSFVPRGGAGGGGSGGSAASKGPKTHALTGGDIAAVVLGMLALAAVVVVGVLRVQRGSFAAILRPTEEPLLMQHQSAN